MIPELPPLYIDHLVQPHGQEDLSDGEAEGSSGSMVGGLGVRVTLSWRADKNGDAVIRAASARVFGSAAPLAPASYLSEYITGLTTEAAEEIRAEDLLQALAGSSRFVLPEAVSRGAAFAISALHCALGLPGMRPSDPEGDGILVCRCLTVGDRAIRRAIREGADSADAIGEACRAGTGCGSCYPDLLQILHEERIPPVPPPPRDLHPIARITLARVAPILEAQGQAIRDVQVTDDAVCLGLYPQNGEALLPPRGAQAVARRVLREIVSEDVAVELLPI